MRAILLYHLPAAAAATHARIHDPYLNQLLQQRNLVSIDQLIESTPPPTLSNRGYAEDKDGAEFLNTRLGRVLSEAGNIGLDASVVRSAETAVESSAENPAVIIQQLIAMMRGAAPDAAPPPLSGASITPPLNGASQSQQAGDVPTASARLPPGSPTSALPLLSPSMGIPSLGLPSVGLPSLSPANIASRSPFAKPDRGNSVLHPELAAPSLLNPALAVPTLPPIEVPSAVSAYNQAIEKIQETADRLSLPSINAFNATLPEIDSIGSGAGIPDVLELVGQNLGSSMGASAGNIAAGTTGLFANYAKSLKDGFVSVLSTFSGASRRRLDDDNDDDDDQHKSEDEKRERHKRPKEAEPKPAKPKAEDQNTHMNAKRKDSDSQNSVSATPSTPYDPEHYYGGFHMPHVAYPPPSMLFPAPYPLHGGDQQQWGNAVRAHGEHLYGQSDDVFPYEHPFQPYVDPQQLFDNGLYEAGDTMHPYADVIARFGDPEYLYADSMHLYGDGMYGAGMYGADDIWANARRLVSVSLQADHLEDGQALLGNRRQLLASMTPFAFSLSDLSDPDRLRSALNSTLPNSLLSSLGLGNHIFNNPFFSNRVLSTAALSPLASLSPATSSPLTQNSSPSSVAIAPNDPLASLSSAHQQLLNHAASLTSAAAPVLTSSASLQSAGPSALEASTAALENPFASLSPSAASFLSSLASLTQTITATPPAVPSSPAAPSESAPGGAGIPAVPTVPVASEAVGSSVGDTLGSTFGGLIGGLTSLVGSTASSATNGFLQGAIPPAGPWLAKTDTTSSSRRLLSANKRALQSSDEKGMREGVTCAVAESSFSSGRVMTFANIESLRVCQLICQTYSDPLVIYKCAETSSIGDVCLAVSYSQIGGRCDLHFALDGEYEIEGFDSAPVVCPGTTFVQPAKQIQTILNANANASECLEAQAVTIQRVQETAKPAPVAMAAAPTLPKMPPFLNENAATESIWRYNPDTPNATDFRVDVIYQVHQASQPPPAGKAFWGSSTGVPDWRHCALFCVLDADCHFWTYLFDSLTYNETGAGCRLATNTEPSARTLAGGPRAISGPRLTYLPLELFGAALNQTDEAKARRLVADPALKKWHANHQPPARLEESPLLPSIVDKRLLMSLTGRQLQESVVSAPNVGRVPCEEYGFIYHSAYSSLTSAKTIPTNLFSLTALTVEKCREACQRTSGCRGFQLVPVATLAASSRLQGSQRSSCLMLSQIAHKLPADPMIISGVISNSSDKLCSVNDFPLSTAVVGHSLDEVAEAVSGPLDDSDRGEDEDGDPSVAVPESDTGCVTPEGYGRQFDRDISFRGTLISGQPNVISGVSNAAGCWKECANVEACQAFSWGPWKGCYLLATVENMLVADAGIVSGYKKCDLNEAQEYETLKRRLQAIGGPRDVSTCGRAVRGRVYDQGALIANLTDEHLTENQCFHRCRQTDDCYYVTYFNTQQANRRLQLSARPKSTIPLRRLQESDAELYQETLDLPALSPQLQPVTEGSSLPPLQSSQNHLPISNTPADTPPGAGVPIVPAPSSRGTPINPLVGDDIKPNAGIPISPITGSIVQPEAGAPLNPVSGSVVEPAAGKPANPVPGSSMEQGSDDPMTPISGSAIEPVNDAPTNPILSEGAELVAGNLIDSILGSGVTPSSDTADKPISEAPSGASPKEAVESVAENVPNPPPEGAIEAISGSGIGPTPSSGVGSTAERAPAHGVDGEISPASESSQPPGVAAPPASTSAVGTGSVAEVGQAADGPALGKKPGSGNPISGALPEDGPGKPSDPEVLPSSGGSLGESGSKGAPKNEQIAFPAEATCLLFERVGQMVNVEAGLGVSVEVNCDVLGDLDFNEPDGHSHRASQMMLPTLVVVASGGLIFVAAAMYIGVRERRRHQRASLIKNLEITSPGSSLTPSDFGHMNFNAFGMKSPVRATGSPDRLERGSPAAKVLDFEAVEPKSTGKRLKKTF